MRPSSIPDEEISEGYHRMVMGPPLGSPIDGDIRALEMLCSRDESGFLYRTRIVLEEGDLERLAAGKPFWITFWGGVVPFDVAMGEG